MESILNPAYPHIFEKIFMCLNRDSISNFRFLNHHWKNTLENVFTKDLAKLMLLRKFKELADIISITVISALQAATLFEADFEYRPQIGRRDINTGRI